ncbi:MAG: hypothetical protein M3Y72_07145, partial [Acidobacteriota bacterium]|nr:hypothetical protein [Acidobacteriota bacterium]
MKLKPTVVSQFVDEAQMHRDGNGKRYAVRTKPPARRTLRVLVTGDFKSALIGILCGSQGGPSDPFTQKDA